MKKKSTLLLCLGILVMQTPMAQINRTAIPGNIPAANNPVRTVQFQLKENERIIYDEYYLMLKQNKNRYAFVTYNPQTGNYSFVFNGKRIIEETTRLKWFHENWRSLIPTLDLNSPNGYKIIFKRLEGDEENVYINFHGSIEGPYEDVCLLQRSWKSLITLGNGMQSCLATNETDYDFLYKLAGKWYARKDGKNRKVSYIEESYGNSASRIYVNGELIGTYEYVVTSSLHINLQGKFSFLYKNDDNWYVNINGEVNEFESRDEAERLLKSFNPSYGEEEDEHHTFLPSGVTESEVGGSSIELYSSDKQHSFDSSPDYNYIVIDGERFGNAPAMSAWYDHSEYAFYWTALENDKQLVLYEYRLR